MMAFRLVRHIGIINTLGDDAAHSLDLGVLSPNNAVRVTEVGGNDVSVKITEAGTAATATNGFTKGKHFYSFNSRLKTNYGAWRGIVRRNR